MASPFSVVLPYWLDRPALEALEIGLAAAELGAAELWVGEMMTFDAFALATAIARDTRAHGHMRLVVGPLAIAVRTAATMALGIASVSALGGRRADLALGASTPVVVSGWHGRTWGQSVAAMREYVDALKPMLAGERSNFAGEHVESRGFRLAADAPHSTLTVAAFAPRMVRLAAQVADRVVVNLVTPAQVSRIRREVDAAAQEVHRPAPPLAVWVPVALDPDEAAFTQLARQLVVYLAAPGYRDMFVEAGFGETVRLARSGVHPREVLAAIPRELISAIAAVGDDEAVLATLESYRRAGADEVAIVPVTAHDPGARNTLHTLRPR
jgi:probable F420-dependent oxidoreductase